MIRIPLSLLLLLMLCVTTVSAQHYTRGATRLGIIGGVNLGGEEATLKYANYTAHPYGMTTMEYFVVDRFALAGSLFAGTLAAEISGRTLFPGYGKQPITAYDTKYYGASAGVDWMLPTFWAMTPIAKFRLGAVMHHTRINGTEGFERRLSKGALLYSVGGGMEYSMHRDVKLFFSYDLVLTNSDEIDGLASGDQNDALSVVSLGLTFLLNPGKGQDVVPDRLDARPARPSRATRDGQPPSPGSTSSGSDAGLATAPSTVDENFDPVRGGLAIEQSPHTPTTFVPVEQGGALQLSTSLVLTPIRRFADLEDDPMLFTLTARQTGSEPMQLKNYVEILRDNKTIYQGNVELRLSGREQRFSAAEFLDLEELLIRLEGDAPLRRGNYIVRISTVAWDHELSSLSQAKFLNMDLRPIFGQSSDEARGAIAAKAVDVATEEQDALVVNFFDAAQKTSAASIAKPGSEAAREAVRIAPFSMTSESQEQFLSEGVQRSFTEALKLRNLAAGNPNPSRLKVVITEVYFPLDEDRLTEEARVLLDNAARHLNQHPEIYAEIRGYANDVGDETYNATIARHRAQRVIEYLVRQKTSSWRLTANDSDEYLAPVRPGEDPRTGRKVEIVLISR